MSQARGESAERYHLVVLPIGRRKVSYPVEHRVDETRRDRRTFSNQLGKVIAVQQARLSRLIDAWLADVANETGERKQAGHVARLPLHELSLATPSVDVHGAVTFQHDDHDVHDVALVRKQLPRCVAPQLAVRGQPFQLVPRSATERAVRDESLDELPSVEG